MINGLCRYSLGFSRDVASVDSGVLESGQFAIPLVAISSEPIKIKAKVIVKVYTTKILSMVNFLCRYCGGPILSPNR